MAMGQHRLVQKLEALGMKLTVEEVVEAA